MVKITSRKQKGIQQGVQKHKIRLNPNQGEQQPPAVFAKTGKKIGSLAAKTWRTVLETSSKLFLIPIQLDQEDGLAKLTPPWKRCIHYIIILLYWIMTVYKLTVTVRRALSGMLDLTTYVSGISSIITLGAAFCTVGTALLSNKMCDLINSWQSLLKVMEAETGKRRSLFDDYSTNLKILACAVTLVLALSMFSLCAEVARHTKMRTVQDWERVYSMYRSMQVYNAVAMNLLKVVAVVVPFGGCLGVILALYVTVRPSNIPLLLYPVFPLAVFMTMTIITLMATDAVNVKIKAEEVASNLQTAMYSEWMRRRLDIVERKVLVRRVKSLRPVYLRVGEFAEVSFELPINAWDEVLNQLLFLLSL